MVTEEELLEQARKAEKELENGVSKSKKPIRLIIGLGLALLLIMLLPAMYFEGGSEPHNIPTLSDVEKFLTDDEYDKVTSDKSFLAQLNPSDPTIKNVAAYIAVESCEDNRVCHAKALFYFVQRNIEYVSDPPDEYLEHPIETLRVGGADCDGQAILLANLLQATGFTTRFVFVPQHSYVQMLLPEAPSWYKDSGNWINMDPTCKSCKFGEEPRKYIDSPKRYSP